MDYFKNKLQEKYVTLKKAVRLPQPEFPSEVIECKNMSCLDAFQGPYVECVKEHVKEYRKQGGQRLLLVTENRNVVLKTAALLVTDCIEEEDDEDEWCTFDEYDEYEEYEKDFSCASMIHLDFQNYCNCDKKDIVYRAAVAATNGMNENNIVFTGLENDNDLENALYAITFSKKINQYVAILPGQLKLPAVQRMIYEYGFEMLLLPKLDINYYKGVLEDLLEDADFTLAKGLKQAELVQRLQKQRGSLLCEEDLAFLLDKGVAETEKDNGRTVLQLEDFDNLISTKQKMAWERLMAMNGLEEFKEASEEFVAYAKEQQLNQQLQPGHNHMVFYGRPGTGKTTCAELLASLLAEEGCGNGKCVVATRKDLVGTYVGHTAPMVARKFEEAKGGILFVDEAGFFLQRETGGFVDEALKEFVRYMEKETDVTVIFAMYPREAKELMNMDEGLKSRIKRFVKFKDYSNEQLLEIAMSMFEKNGYKLEKSCNAVIEGFISRAKEQEKEKFGNARTVRNLVEMTINQVSLRHFREKRKAPKLVVTAEDVNNAVKKLQGINMGKTNAYGFYHESDNKIVKAI